MGNAVGKRGKTAPHIVIFIAVSLYILVFFFPVEHRIKSRLYMCVCQPQVHVYPQSNVSSWNEGQEKKSCGHANFTNSISKFLMRIAMVYGDNG